MTACFWVTLRTGPCYYGMLCCWCHLLKSCRLNWRVNWSTLTTTAPTGGSILSNNDNHLSLHWLPIHCSTAGHMLRKNQLPEEECSSRILIISTWFLSSPYRKFVRGPSLSAPHVLEVTLVANSSSVAIFYSTPNYVTVLMISSEIVPPGVLPGFVHFEIVKFGNLNYNNTFTGQFTQKVVCKNTQKDVLVLTQKYRFQKNQWSTISLLCVCVGGGGLRTTDLETFTNYCRGVGLRCWTVMMVMVLTWWEPPIQRSSLHWPDLYRGNTLVIGSSHTHWPHFSVPVFSCHHLRSHTGTGKLAERAIRQRYVRLIQFLTLV